MTYFVEQTAPVDVNTYHYRVTFAPRQIIPNIDLQLIEKK